MKLFGLTIQREVTGIAGNTAGTAAGGTRWLEKIVAAGNERSSMNVAACWRCVNLISDAVAEMRLNYKRYDRNDGIYRTFTKGDRDRLYYLLNVRPNDRQNAFVFKKNIVMHMLLRGNALVVPVDATNHAIDFRLSPVDHLVLITGNVSYLKNTNQYLISDNVQNVPPQTVSANCVWHFRNPGTDGGFWGDSTVGHAARTLNMLATSDEHSLKTTATGGRIKAILSGVGAGATIGSANKKQMENAAEDVNEKLQMQDIITLPDKNLELKPLSLSAAEQQFLENRKFSVTDVARWFGVPMHKLGETSSNYKSIDAAQVDFYVEAVQPICSQIECELHAKTTTPDDWESVKFDFDETPIFQLDATARAARMKSMLENGVMSVNDLRREMDIAPVEDGDVILMSANLKSIATLKSEGASPKAVPQGTGTDVEP